MQNEQQNLQLDVRYGQQASLYTSQFLINAGAEEITLDCSSGVDTANGNTVVPIHTRLSMSWQAAERLHSLLHQALSQRSKGSPVPTPHIRTNAAKLPSFGDANV